MQYRYFGPFPFTFSFSLNPLLDTTVHLYLGRRVIADVSNRLISSSNPERAFSKSSMGILEVLNGHSQSPQWAFSKSSMGILEVPTEGHSGTLAHADQSYTFLLDTFWLLVDTIKAWDDHKPSNRPNKVSKRPIKACFWHTWQRSTVPFLFLRKL